MDSGCEVTRKAVPCVKDFEREGHTGVWGDSFAFEPGRSSEGQFQARLTCPHGCFGV